MRTSAVFVSDIIAFLSEFIDELSSIHISFYKIMSIQNQLFYKQYVRTSLQNKLIIYIPCVQNVVTC